MSASSKWLLQWHIGCHCKKWLMTCNPQQSRSNCQKSNRPRIETILHFVLKFQFNRVCFQGGEVSENFDGKAELEMRKTEERR